jgi:hypothetical protein
MQKDPRTHKIIGAVRLWRIHNEMGPGHLKAVYQECLDPPIGG